MTKPRTTIKTRRASRDYLFLLLSMFAALVMLPAVVLAQGGCLLGRGLHR